MGENFEALAMLEKALKNIPKEEIQKFFNSRCRLVYLPGKELG